ncbi:unnamed protein product [Medioppia subpectinata]|uniref:Uncharacterized protein n=1 Tax=Medioppia subpectinata TaxID=1979941 RepID=A0A7R9KD90_9ACAR|nr:unnamed protein product [Medioppia subpectinata]CAG2101358.1 unnamed protein product [Medioppia subpectinata]
MPSYKSAHQSSHILQYMATDMNWEIDSQIAAVLLDIDNTYESCFAGNITDKPFCDQITDTRKDPYLDFIFYKRSLEFPQLKQMCNNAYEVPLKEAQHSGNLPTNAILLPISGYLRMKYNTFVKNSNGTHIEVEYERTVIIFEKSVTENVMVLSDSSHILTDVSDYLKTIHHIIRLQDINRLIAFPMKAGINTSLSQVHSQIKSYRYSTTGIHPKQEDDMCSAVFKLTVDTDYTVVSAVSNPSSAVNDTQDFIILRFKSLFYKNGKIYGYGKEDDGTLWDMSIKNTKYYITPSSEKLKDLFACPHRYIYLPVSNRRKGVCNEKIESNERHSVFNIGLKLYHQKDRYFYVYDKRRKQFDLDMDITQLLAYYFNTRERVVGYTVDYDFASKVRNGSETYEVVFHGKSHPKYQMLGQNIFAMFSMRIDLGVKSLLPITNTSRFIGKSFIAITFGSVSTIIPSNQSITAIGVSYWKSQSYMYWLTNPMHLRALYYVSDTKWRFLFPFEHNFDIKYWNEMKAVLNGKVIGFFTLESDKTPMIYALIEESVYRQNKLRIYEITRKPFSTEKSSDFSLLNPTKRQ